MAVISLASAKGSPGVTTTALALAWAWPEATGGRRVLVVDADMAGGDISSGYLRGAVSADRGLLSLAAERATELHARLWDHLISLDSDQTRLLLTGITDRSQARALAPQWPALAEALTKLAEEQPPVDVLVDLGRLGTTSEATQLLERTELLLLGLRTSLTATAAALSVVRGLAQSPGGTPGGSERIGALVVGAGRPYGMSEVAEAIGIPVVTAISWDPANAEVLSAGLPAAWRFTRSALMRSAGAAVRDIHHFLQGTVGLPEPDHKPVIAGRRPSHS